MCLLYICVNTCVVRRKLLGAEPFSTKAWAEFFGRLYGSYFLAKNPQLFQMFRIRIQLNPDPAKNLNPDPEDFESVSGFKLFINTS